jgi:FKBP-type peptidyl-prolyl cis-trans isomerase
MRLPIPSPLDERNLRMRSATAAALALLPLLALAAEPAPPAPAPGQPAPPAEKAAPPAAPATPPAAKPAPPADPQKALYAIGLAVADSLEVFSLTPAELETVMKGVRDGVAGKPRFPLDTKMQAAMTDLARARAPKAQEKAAAREKREGAPYLAKMAKEKGARKTPSGAIVIPLLEGTGASPTASDTVKVHYTGTLVSGRVFETTVHRGQPAEFPLGKTVPCWVEAFPLLKTGARAKIVCPAETAYGASGKGGIPANAVLTFEVELLEIVKK